MTGVAPSLHAALAQSRPSTVADGSGSPAVSATAMTDASPPAVTSDAGAMTAVTSASPSVAESPRSVSASRTELTSAASTPSALVTAKVVPASHRPLGTAAAAGVAKVSARPPDMTSPAMVVLAMVVRTSALPMTKRRRRSPRARSWARYTRRGSPGKPPSSGLG
ncbi:hypothetical protein ASJ30_15460 [Janibacter indicus]|uniref:Uncharacterized protein n=1 Tax=Janibacter indicus TaxID=857417 RepID=A0A1L3MK97_9MICO|nr:hypothetical protein ASJ30_15460 [Janibacter indicus]